MSITHRWFRGIDPRRNAIHHQGRTSSWGDRSAGVRRATAWLRAQGVRRGDVVALQLPRSPLMLDLFLATQASGAIALPLNDRYTAAEVRHPLVDAGARLAVLVHPGHADGTGAVAVPAEGLEAVVASHADDDLGPEVSPDAVGVICYTSGTTGVPKGARIRQGNIAATVDALHEAWRWSPDDVLIHALPLYHIHGLFVAACGALRAGASLVLLSRFEARDTLEALVLHQATVFMGVPTFYSRFLPVLAEEPDWRDRLRNLRLFTSGSAPLPARVHEAFAARTGHQIVERYGMTEIGIVMSNPYDGERRAGSIGLPLPGVELRIVGEDGVDVETDEVGELWFRGPSVFEGYHGRPDASAAALEGGWMHTGDHGRRDADGYVHLMGRRSDLILVGGLNVYPGEVERVLGEHPAVAEVAAFGVDDDDLGEHVEAAVVGVDPAVEPDDLLEWMRSALAPYKCPRRIHLVSSLPRNAMGKVVKRALRDHLSRRSAP